MTESLETLVVEQSKLYEDGVEYHSRGNLTRVSWRFFETQKNLVEKVQHVNEFENGATTARKALMIGLNVLSSPYVDEETQETVKNEMTNVQEQNGGE